MNANKTFSNFSLSKIWEKLMKHDRAMNSTLLVLNSGNWVQQADGTFKNNVTYSTFTENDKLTVDLYDDNTLTNLQIEEYEQYIDSFETINGALVATANTKPSQTFTVVIKGDFECNEASIGNINELSQRIEDCFQSVSNGKALLASAITDMGVETDATATFEEMVENILSIQTGIDTSGATATAADITEGKTAYANGQYIVGIRPAPATIDSGTHSFSISGMRTVDYTIYFAKEFDTVPKVSYTLSGSRMSMSNVQVFQTHVIFSVYHDKGNEAHSGTIVWTATV